MFRLIFFLRMGMTAWMSVASTSHPKRANAKAAAGRQHSHPRKKKTKKKTKGRHLRRLIVLCSGAME